jgi:asparagine synthase (glutamine-hydrolysing)
MSVQAGVLNFDDQAVDGDVLARIAGALAVYAPDRETRRIDGRIGMAYGAFHTTTESRVEHQPWTCPLGRMLTWDGRLDNRHELIRELRDNLETGNTDVAIVAAAFARWGKNCFPKLRGDWALAIWDPREKELILARDYAGVRQLFYHLKARNVIWCTYLEPLALSGDQFSLCDEYFAGYLASWPDANLTPYREIHSVPPGYLTSIRDGRVSLQSYWSFDPTRETRHKTDAEYEAHFRYLFRQAVRRRLRTDSPILADLSGGLDSSAAVCMADDILAKEGAEAPSLDTFSILALDEPDEEDSLYLASVERKRGRMGHHAVIREIGTSPFECGDFAATPIFSGRKEINTAKSVAIERGKYRVLLSGSGGDELLGQATDPRVQLADLLRLGRFFEFAKQLRAWSLLSRRPCLHLAMNAALLQLPVSVRASISENGKIAPWINAKFARKTKLSTRQCDLAEGSWFWLPSVQDWFHTIMTLARGTTKVLPAKEETRYPYRDQDLVEFLVSIPTEQLLRPGHRRSLMRRSLTGIVPGAILDRKTKSGANRYFSATLDKHWNSMEAFLREPLVSQLGFIKKREFHAALRDAKNGNMPPHTSQLMKTVSWEFWLREATTRGILSSRPSNSVSPGSDFVALEA